MHFNTISLLTPSFIKKLLISLSTMIKNIVSLSLIITETSLCYFKSSEWSAFDTQKPKLPSFRCLCEYPYISLWKRRQREKSLHKAPHWTWEWRNHPSTLFPAKTDRRLGGGDIYFDAYDKKQGKGKKNKKGGWGLTDITFGSEYKYKIYVMQSPKVRQFC